MQTGKVINELSSLGYLRYLLEQEFEKSMVDKLVETASRYPKEDVERLADAIHRFGATPLLSAAAERLSSNA